MHRTITASLSALVLLACSGTNSDESKTDELIVGGDRDAHDCIPSAGYQWSEVQSNCIRLWEQGNALIHQGSGDPNFNAYAVFGSDHKMAEIFLPDGAGNSVLRRTSDNEWKSLKADLVLTLNEEGFLSLGDKGGFKEYFGETTVEIASSMAVNDVAEGIRESSEEAALFDVAIVRELEDGPYPMFTLHVTIVNTDKPASFSMNAEAIDKGDVDLYNLKGKKVMLEYTVDTDYRVMAIGKIGSPRVENTESQQGWYFTEGRLEGAGKISGGDLPDTLTIYGRDGNVVEFSYFIDDEMKVLDGKDIAAWLAPQEQSNVYYIRTISK